MSVPIKLTTFRVSASADPAHPITVGFLYDGPGKDSPKEGVEIDVTVAEAKAMARALLDGCAIVSAPARDGTA